MPEIRHDLTRTVLAILCIAGLIAASFVVVRPFLGALVWATTLVIATWPLMLKLQAALGGRRGLAVTLMTLALLLIVVLPLSVAIGAIVVNSDRIMALVMAVPDFHFPAATRGVALGVVVTAIAQSLVAGAGLALAGVPHAGILTAIILMLCIAQLGPVLVLVPAVIWLFATGATVPGIILVVFTVMALTMDNFLRPFLIKRGADLPLLLILVGVIGGLLAFGLLGLFLGPVVLAITYTLLQNWIADADA